MFASNYIIKSGILLVLVLLTTLGCRKKIDFEKEKDAVIAPIDPNAPYYLAWQHVNLNFEGYPLYLSVNEYGSFMYAGTTSTSTSIGDRVYSIDESLTTNPLFYSQTSDITGIEMGVGGNLSFMDHASTQAIQLFNQNGLITTYALAVSGTERINDVYDDGGLLYVAGDFNGIGNNPTSDFVDRINKSTQFTEGMHGIVNEVFDIENWVGDIYVCGDSVLPSGHSIAVWDFTQWLSYGNVINEKVTDIEFYNDTMFIAGYSGSGFALRKGYYGSVTEDQSLINTASSEATTNIQFLKADGRLFAYGTVNLPGEQHISVLEYQNGKWDYVGALGAEPTDLVLFKGYLYALVNGQVYRLEV